MNEQLSIEQRKENQTHLVMQLAIKSYKLPHKFISTGAAEILALEPICKYWKDFTPNLPEFHGVFRVFSA